MNNLKAVKVAKAEVKAETKEGVWKPDLSALRSLYRKLDIKKAFVGHGFSGACVCND
jgi:hypothetical protein